MNNKHSELVIIHNIIAPYKVALFNELVKLIPNLRVIFVAERENRRDWDIDLSSIKFSYTLLFEGPIEDFGILKTAKSTWKILKSLNPKSLIICDYSNIFGWIALFWGIVSKAKLAFWLDSTKDDRKHYFPKEQIKQLFLKQFQLFLSPGIKTAEYLIYMKAAEDKIIQTGYAVDNAFYLNELEKLDILKSFKRVNTIKTTKNFLFVGRLSEEKNILTLLSAFKNVSNIDNNWGLVIVGDGPQKVQVGNYINNNALSGRIHMFGFVQQKDIVEYYSYCDVFILPSTSEPWGLVINEAMLCKLPIIVSNKCGSAPELVKEGINGFSFDPLNQKELESIMKDFIEGKHDISKMGNNSQKIIQTHSPQQVSKLIYKNLRKYNLLTG